MEKVTELWAVVDLEGNVMKSRGGSSTSQKLLVYPTKNGCERVLSNPWTKQVIPDRTKVKVICVYKKGE